MSVSDDLAKLDRWRPFTTYLLRNGHGDTAPRCWAGAEWGDTTGQCNTPAEEGDLGLCLYHAKTLVK